MSRWTLEFKVGLFTLVALVALGYIFFVLSPDFFNNHKVVTYYTIVDDAGGIVPKTHVKTNGVSIGKVKKIELQINQTRIELEVDASVAVPVGSEIAIKEKGLLGDVFVEIERADDKGEYIKDGGFIPPKPDQVSLSKLISMAGSIGRDIKKITASLSNAMGTEEGNQKVADIVNDIHSITHNLKGILADNRENVDKIIHNVEKTTDSLRFAIGDKKQDLSDIVDNVKSLTVDLKHVSHTLKDVMREENKQKLERILTSFDDTMKSVRQIASKIDKGEGTIGKLINDPKVLEDFNGAVNDVRAFLTPARQMEIGVDYHGEIRNDSGTQQYFNLKFQTRPDKFYLVGLTDVLKTVTETTYEDLHPTKESPDADGEIRYRETVYKQNNLRFNLQYGRRWHFAQVRFGLFESTGGVATDLFAFNNRVSFSLEAFDWRKTPIRKVAHFKTYVSLLLSNHLYTMLGVNDFTRVNYYTGKYLTRPDYFFAGGVAFNDQDLKALFGLSSLAPR